MDLPKRKGNPVPTEFTPLDEPDPPEIRTDSPAIEATTGLKGWAGETWQPGEKPMKGGNISNVPHPYIAFDFECLMYVPERFTKKVADYEKWPWAWYNKKSMQYYKQVPRAMTRLTSLLQVAYNIAIVYVGPKRLWMHRTKLLEPFPYTSLFAIADPSEFIEQITLNEAVTTYYTMSDEKRKHAGPKAVLFDSWDNLGMEKR